MPLILLLSALPSLFLLLRGFLLTSSPSLFTLNLKSAFSRGFSFRKLQIFISQTTDFHFVSFHFVSQTTVSPFHGRQDVEHSPFAVGSTRRNATLRNVSQSIFLRKEIALLRKVVGKSACYTSIYVFDTKRRTTRFKVRKALNNKFVCVFITCKVYRNWVLIKFTTGSIVRQENRS